MQPIQLTPIASTFLIIGYIVFSLLTFGVLAALAWGVFRLNTELEKLNAKADPLLGKTDEILGLVSEKVTTIGTSAENILVQSEAMTGNLTAKVDQTASAVQKTVHAPLIGLNALLAGVQYGATVFRQGNKQRSKPREEKQKLAATLEGKAVSKLASIETIETGE
jgi:predicted PurR-regulated permease PerM